MRRECRARLFGIHQNVKLIRSNFGSSHLGYKPCFRSKGDHAGPRMIPTSPLREDPIPPTLHFTLHKLECIVPPILRQSSAVTGPRERKELPFEVIV